MGKIHNMFCFFSLFSLIFGGSFFDFFGLWGTDMICTYIYIQCVIMYIYIYNTCILLIWRCLMVGC